jgi:hypothetical protein
LWQTAQVCWNTASCVLCGDGVNCTDAGPDADIMIAPARMRMHRNVRRCAISLAEKLPTGTTCCAGECNRDTPDVLSNGRPYREPISKTPSPGASAALVDRAEWFTLDDARDKIIKGQSVFLDRLEQILRPMPSI